MATHHKDPLDIRGTLWSGRREVQELNAIAHAQGDIETLQAHVVTLARFSQAAAHDLARLRATVEVMAELLVASNVVTADALHARIDAALRALEPAPPAPSATPDPLIACGACGARVARETTTVTDHGTLCDDCFRREAASAG